MFDIRSFIHIGKNRAFLNGSVGRRSGVDVVSGGSPIDEVNDEVGEIEGGITPSDSIKVRTDCAR